MTTMLWLELFGFVAFGVMAFWCDRFCSREMEQLQKRYNEVLAQQDKVSRMLDKLKAGIQ